MKIKNIFLETTTSTQDVAASLISSNHGSEPFFVLAKTQSDGRGRAGRRWSSNASGNLYLSVVIKMPGLRDITLLPILATVSIAISLELESIKDFCYKWPNDIMIGQKKLCGVLVEKIGDYYIIGIGMNILYAPQLEDRETTCLLEHNHLDSIGFSRHADIEAELNKVAQKISAALIGSALDFSLRNNCAFLTNFTKKLWKSNGDAITILAGGAETRGIFRGINRDGSLSMGVWADGAETTKTFFYGDVS